MDATTVWTILVPATMRLLGDRNWYPPKRLGWPRSSTWGDHPAAVEVEEELTLGRPTIEAS
jgi:RND superfamily putative drug exporter